MSTPTTEEIERKRAIRRAISRRYYHSHKQECAEKARAYREKHRERMDAQHHAWKAANPDKVRAGRKAWADANPEKVAETNRKQRAKNPEATALRKAIYKRENKDKVRALGQNRRARKKNAGGRLSRDIGIRLLKLQKGRCACCGESLGDSYHLDHILPLALGGDNTDSNVQLLRAICNLKKGARHPVEFMQSQGRLL